MEEKLVIWALIAASIFLLFLGMYCLFQMAMSDSSTDYCYIVGIHATVNNSNTFNLMGYRRWNSDLYIGNYSDLPTAIEAANAIGCYIRQ